MRTRCAVLLAGLLTALAAAALAPAALAAPSTPAAGSAYSWVQPWQIHGALAPAGQASAGLPASITLEPGPLTAEALHTSYPWVQPWDVCCPVAPDVGHWTQPPAS